jgi:hypothetical protein
LLRRLGFVDRAKNSVDPSSNEFDAQALEMPVSFALTPAPFWPGDAIFVVFSVNGAAHLSRPTRQWREVRPSMPSVGTEAAAPEATRLQHQDIPSSELIRDADMTNGHRKSVLRVKGADIAVMILPAAGVT